MSWDSRRNQPTFLQLSIDDNYRFLKQELLEIKQDQASIKKGQAQVKQKFNNMEKECEALRASSTMGGKGDKLFKYKKIDSL